MEHGENIIFGLQLGIAKVLKDIGSWIWDNIFTPFINGFKKAFGIHSPSSVMSEQGNFIVEGLKNGITGAIDAVLAIFTNLKEDIGAVLNGIISFIKDVFSGDWKSAWDGIATIFEGIWNGVKDFFRGVINGIIDIVNGVISGINSLSIKIPETPFSKALTLGFNIPSIPRLAAGAVVPPNAPFLAMLGDNRNEPEIVSPISSMKQAFIEAIAESGLMGSEGGDTILMIDGQRFARITNKYMRGEERRRGVRLVEGVV